MRTMALVLITAIEGLMVGADLASRAATVPAVITATPAPPAPVVINGLVQPTSPPISQTLKVTCLANGGIYTTMAPFVPGVP